MKKEEIMERLSKVFREVFDDESILLTDDTTAKDIESWNSLTHIALISEIEDEFSIEFAMGDVANMKNVREMADRIAELL